MVESAFHIHDSHSLPSHTYIKNNTRHAHSHREDYNNNNNNRLLTPTPYFPVSKTLAINNNNNNLMSQQNIDG